MKPKHLSISIGSTKISALWHRPPKAMATLVLAHGAGAGMEHRSMAAIADGLGSRGIASLRFNFPYMERGSKRPDNPATAHAAIRSAAGKAHALAPDLALFAGGKSFGGRMTSQAQAVEPILGVSGLVFFGFPLHPAGAPAISRADHLTTVTVPMLFLQGSRDALADLKLLTQVTKRLGRRATLIVAKDADHSFHVPAKSGRSDGDVLATLLDSARDWIVSNSSTNPQRKTSATLLAGKRGQDVD